MPCLGGHMHWVGFKPTTLWLRIDSTNHYTTVLHRVFTLCKCLLIDYDRIERKALCLVCWWLYVNILPRLAIRTCDDNKNSIFNQNSSLWIGIWCNTSVYGNIPNDLRMITVCLPGAWGHHQGDGYLPCGCQWTLHQRGHRLCRTVCQGKWPVVGKMLTVTSHHLICSISIV